MAVKKPATKKTPAKKAEAKKAPAKKAPAKKKSTIKKKALVYTAEQVYSMIEQAAYFAAENDTFQKDPTEYWVEAEAAVNKMIKD